MVESPQKLTQGNLGTKVVAFKPELRIVFSDIFSAVSRLVDITQWYYLQWDITAQYEEIDTVLRSEAYP
jgi:hypothetical protein